MGCIQSLSGGGGVQKCGPGTAESPVKAAPEGLPAILQLTELSRSGRHSFTEKTFRKGRLCEACQQKMDGAGVSCKECKVAVHKTCEDKVPPCSWTPSQHNSVNSSSQKKRGSMQRSKSEEQVMERVMERRYDFDLTYITERIISVFFLPELEESRYRQNIQEVAAMLRSKHQDKFLLLNLSEKRHDISRLNPKVQDFGWPDLHAPPLDRICSVCKAVETWLTADPHNVVVLHCKGHKGKTGVIVAAYMHYSKISAGADQALTTLAMRKFCEDKVSSSLQPSQHRYIYYFGGLLSGTIKMNSSPLFLHQIFIPSLPNFQVGGGFYPFLKIYQSLQLVYTSGVYDPKSSRARKLCVAVEPALLLKGDIMVKCYHQRSRAAEREVVFRTQFHTCTVHGAQLWFGKNELDLACADARFPPDATVEFVFSHGPEKMQITDSSDASVTVSYDLSDPVVRWDSYENFNLHHQDSVENIPHTRGPLDGSLYAQVRKRRGPGSAANGCLTSSPTVKPQVPARPGVQVQVPVRHPEPPPPSAAQADDPDGPGGRRAEPGGESDETERETEILDDGGPSGAGAARGGRPCCTQAGAKMADGGRDGHCLARCNKKNPKSQTLPALPSKSPPPLSPHTERCHRHGSHPLPELPWERPTQPLPCLHRPCFPYPARELTHPHSHTLPASVRLRGGEDCPLFHYPAPPPAAIFPPQALSAAPYREMFFGPPPSSGCPCRECSGRRERQAAAPVRTFHPAYPEQAAGIQRARDAATLWEGENPWGAVREADLWPCKAAAPGFCTCHSAAPDQGPSTAHPGFLLGPQQSCPAAGYRTPRHSCPCSPYQAFPIVSNESQGYTSGYRSGSASPLPAGETGPTAGDERPNEPKTRTGTVTVRVSDGKSDWSDGSGPLGADSDHDYTVIGGGSPTHTEDSVTPDSSHQSQETPADSNNSNKSATELQTELQTETRNSNASINSTNPSGEFPQSPPSGAEKTDPPQTSPPAALAISPVEVQLNGSTLPDEAPPESAAGSPPGIPSSSPSNTSLDSIPESPEGRPSPVAAASPPERRVPEGDGSSDLKPPSPVPEGYHTPTFPLASYYYPLLSVPHVPYTGYTAVTIPAIQPPLPEKKRLSSAPPPFNGHPSVVRASSAPPPAHPVAFLPSTAEQRRRSGQHGGREEADARVNAKFVQDSSKYWYKPGISRDQAIAVLKDKEPGTFLIRDSNSFQGAYGLALKVATAPPNANILCSKGDPLEQLVRHFLIESGPRGVKIKGCQNESYFGSLSALVYQHSITPISLPCALRIPEKDLVGELQELQSATNTSTAADLLKQGAACNVLYLNSVETESLTGPEAVSKATKCTLALNPRPVATVVHFKVSAQGITLTDSKRRLFFRRHYPISSVTFSSLDPQDHRWTNCDSTSCKMFGFVARRTSSATENVCHLFAEMDPEQPAVAIVNFINKVMLGPQLRR